MLQPYFFDGCYAILDGKNRMRYPNHDKCNRRFRRDTLPDSRKLQLTYSILSDNNSRRPGDRLCLATPR